MRVNTLLAVAFAVSLSPLSTLALPAAVQLPRRPINKPMIENLPGVCPAYDDKIHTAAPETLTRLECARKHGTGWASTGDPQTCLGLLAKVPFSTSTSQKGLCYFKQKQLSYPDYSRGRRTLMDCPHPALGTEIYYMSWRECAARSGAGWMVLEDGHCYSAQVGKVPEEFEYQFGFCFDPVFDNTYSPEYYKAGEKVHFR